MSKNTNKTNADEEKNHVPGIGKPLISFGNISFSVDDPAIIAMIHEYAKATVFFKIYTEQESKEIFDNLLKELGA